ncbi:MAG: response regulator [Hydrogenophaga sp.]|uniref:hybrid sensor histidine kinase/response regulator n=1 Tax=Hydrogenophaga sp. TaxID=1904254 RepID=UPI0016AE281D|nr:ATP-binding protein [Hydrogenophaga sp.]NIM43954.1 response regulator [Hydrogenophaga sp.]NIN29018.1 response regulator [Hydrogenophaga sp.]NIN33495.1 response regulator [Hydrogenophaga sp.]NIN58154.1 response regulator [Hydrogenophaga sp.]NIO54452.1 response regulator [Hydrogenophaga sp.]
MDALPPIAQIPLPGTRFTVAFGGSPGELSAGSRALEARAGGRWADLSILTPDSRAALLAALGHPQSFALDLRLRDDPQGRAIHLHCAGHWRAEPPAHVCLLADIGELRAAHEATDRRLQLLQEMVDSLPLLMIQLDTGADLRCAFAGGALLELITPRERPLVGRDALSLFGQKLFDNIQARLREGTPGQTMPFAWRVIDAQGLERVLEGSLRTLVDEAGRPSGHLLDALETTAYHATMAQLRSSEERVRRFVAASSDAIIVHVDQRIVDANPAACRLLDTPAEALRERRFDDLIAPEERAAYRSANAGASHDAHECGLIDRHGARIAVELIDRTVQRQGRAMRMTIIRDVRDRREAQARIRELIAHLSAQKDRAEAADRAKSLFLSAASHDLRQPIHALGLFLTSLESLTRHPTMPLTTLDELGRRMRASLDALSRLLNSLLDVSRLDANAVVVTPVPVSLELMFSELDEDLADSAIRKGLRLDLMQTSAWAHTDPAVLRRIMDNLVSNAIRYTPRGRVLVGARPRGAAIEIQVWDTGIGIAADQLDAIFGEFYQVSPASSPTGGLRGLGLGLSIVQRSARLLDARLRVRSTPGRGSMFSITVPRGQAVPLAPTPAPSAPASLAAPAGHIARHVLVIDDDPQVLSAMQQLLQAWGHTVWCAADADQAITLAVLHGDRIDLVLTDYHLGGEITASQFIDTVRACLPRPVPVHVFTADTSTPVAQEIRALGLSLLHKPVRHDALQQVLEQEVS